MIQPLAAATDPTAVLAAIDAWLGLERLSLADPETTLDWVHPLPAWAWASAALVALAVAAWSYVHLQGPPWARVPLAGLRALTLMLVAVLLAGPELTRTDERVEPDWVLFLVDRSDSMNVRDVADNGDAITRDRQLRRALARHTRLLTRGLGDDREVRWIGFDRDAAAIADPFAPPSDTAPSTTTDTDANTPPAPAPAPAPPAAASTEPSLPPADGRRTHLRTALDRALDLAHGRPLSGVVIFSDGQSPETLGPDLVQRVNSRFAGVYAVPLGAARPPRDLAIATVDAPTEAFVGDVVPVTVTVDLTGGDPADDPAPLSSVRVELIDPQQTDPETGEPTVLDERSLDETAPGEPVRLRARTRATGPLKWRVRVVDAGGAGGERRELIETNNTASIETRVVDRALRVLYVEAYPRWEFRYLKNLLIREASIEVSTMLLSADRDFAQEGDRPIARLPETREEMEAYDAVILGDVPVDALGIDRMQALRELVADRGAGLIWIGGRAHVPEAYAATPLADLLPMRDPEATSVAALPRAGAAAVATPLAESLGVLQINAPDGEPLALEALPRLYWVQDVGPLKPAAEVIARVVDAADEASVVSEGGARPAVVRMRFGAGEVLYLATDETWRWRYGRGEVVFEQFWIQLVRLLARAGIEDGDRPTVLTLSNRRIDRGQSVVVELISRDPALVARDARTLSAVAVDAEAPEERPERLTLRRRDDPGESAQSGRVTYRAVWRPSRPGAWLVRLDEDAAVAPLRPLEVRPADAEARRPEADHAKLARLAQATGGAVVDPSNLRPLAELIPSRPRRTPYVVREPLWDSWLALIMVIGLLAVEWTGRKLIRLV